MTEDVKVNAVKIGPAWFTIWISDKIHGENGLEMLGLVDTSDCRIVISDNQTIEMKRVSILHEIIHAVMLQGSVEQDEAAVNALAYGLALLLDQNAGFFDWLNGATL